MPLLFELFDMMDAMPRAPKRRGKKQSNHFSDVLNCINGGPLPEDKYKKRPEQRRLPKGGKNVRQALRFFNRVKEDE